MTEYPFQDFCQAAWRIEGADCQVYGTRGQRQKGIDLRTYGQPVNGGSVGQCKCYEVFEAADLRKAIAEFSEHLVFWKDHKIKILRMYVASSCADTKVQDEYAKQKELLGRENIALELHDSQALAVSLRSEPAIVSRFCGDGWVKNICGAGAMALAPNAVLATAFHLSQNGDIFRAWEEDRNKELEALRERIREGDSNAVYAETLGILASSDWGRYSPKLRGIALRILAAIDCNRVECEKAADWINKSRTEDPLADYQVIEAHYAANSQGSTAAHARLETPFSIHAWNLRLSVWLGEGNFAKILEAFNDPPFELTAESYRLKASAQLASGLLEEAVKSADTAFADAPRWLSTRLTAAVVNYQSVVSPMFHAWKHIEWPVPPDLQYVRQDQVALARLRRAAILFKDLLEGPHQDAIRSNLEIWLLAAYATNPDTREDALKLSQSLLEKNPGHFRVVMWAIARNLQFDRPKARAAIDKAIAEQAPTQAAVITLIELMALDDDTASARALLTNHQDLFVRNGAVSEWRLLMIQLLAHAGSWEEAQALLNDETHQEAQWDVRQMLAEIRFKKGGLAKDLADELERIYTESGAMPRLLLAAEAKLLDKEPAWVLGHQEELLRHFPTTDTLRLLMLAAFQAHQYARVLELLEGNRHLLTASGPPDEMVRMQVRALRLLGRLNDALGLAQGRNLGIGHRDNTLELFHLQIALADASGAAATAHLLLPLEDVDVPDLLQVCRSLAPSNHQLAVRFWNKATQGTTLTDRDILDAVDIGFRLGLDLALAPLIQQFQRILASGSDLLYALPLQEVIQLQQQEAQKLNEANRAYNRGLLPVHVTGEALRCSLGFLYHIMLRNNAAANTPLRSAPLLIRSGAHDFQAPLVLKGKAIVLDITSLILARHLDILDVAERHFGSFTLSSWVPISLQKQIHEAISHQPALNKPRDQVHQLLAQGRIKRLSPVWPELIGNDDRVKQMGSEWCSRIAQLQKEGGVFVTFFPVTAQTGERHILPLSPEELRTIIPVGTFLLAMQTAGVISASDVTKCNSVFGVEAQFVGDQRTIESQQVVLLESVIAEGLASAEVLEKIAAFCQLRFSASTAQLVESQHEESHSREELAAWLKDLAEHVSTKIQSGAYKTFSNPPADGDAARFNQHPDLGCFHDLIPTQAEPERITWCDDRLVTSHQTTDAGPIFGVNEVLQALLNEGAITTELYYAKLYELRRSNVRFLPTTPEEILFHLRSTKIISGRIQETAELAALRMSLAAALADTPRLQLPGGEMPNPGMQLGDLPWILNANRAAFEALQELWKGQDVDTAIIQSEWIIDSMIFDLGALRDLHRPELGSRDVTEFYFLNLLEWILVAFRQQSHFLTDRNADSRRRIFFRWMYGRFILPMLTANPDADAALGRSLGTALNQVMQVGRSIGMTQRQAALSALGLLMDLPVPLQDLVEVPRLLQDEFSIEKGQLAVEIGGTGFQYAKFWLAITDAVNGRVSNLQSLEGVSCTMVPGEALPYGHAAVLKRPDQTDLISTNENNPILHEDPDFRRRFLQELSYFDDQSPESRSALIDEIVTIFDPLMRLERLTSVLAESPAFYYKNLASQLDRKEDFPPEELFPRLPTLLLRFTHLTKDGPIEWDLLSGDLISQLGILDTLRRLTLVPRRLPQIVLNHIAKLSDQAFSELITKMETDMVSPICRIHLFELLASQALRGGAWVARAKKFLQTLLTSKPEPSFDAFHTILTYCFRSLEQHPEAATWSTDVFITAAWAHASQLYNIQMKVGVSDQIIETHFKNEIRKVSTRLVGRCEAGFSDATSPRFITLAGLLCRGLGSTFLLLPEEAAVSLRPSTEQIQAAISEETEEVIAFAVLAGETETRSNVLQSFMGGDWLSPLAALIPDRSNWLVQDPRAYAVGRFQEVETNPGNTIAWGELWLLFTMAPVYDDLKDRMRHLLRTVRLSSLLENKGQDAIYGIHFMCTQASQDGSQEILNELRGELARCAGYCQQMRDKNQSFGVDRQSFENIIWSLIQAAQYLELRTPLTDEPAPFCALMNRLIQTCPTMGSILRQRLGGEPPAMPFELNRGIWPFYMRLRAAP